MTPYHVAFDRLDQYIIKKLQESNSIGMSVALTDRDELLRVSTFGISDLAGQIPVTPDTLYEIGSIGKTLTSVLLLQQHEEGQVVELFYGSDWYTNDQYRGPISAQIPEAWKTYLGHYRSHNPWRSNFRVIHRKGILMVVMPSGQAQTLAPMEKGVFSVGKSDRSPERLTFDSILNDKALRVNFSGCPYYRTFTP